MADAMSMSGEPRPSVGQLRRPSTSPQQLPAAFARRPSPRPCSAASLGPHLSRSVTPSGSWANTSSRPSTSGRLLLSTSLFDRSAPSTPTHAGSGGGSGGKRHPYPSGSRRSTSTPSIRDLAGTAVLKDFLRSPADQTDLMKDQVVAWMRYALARARARKVRLGVGARRRQATHGKLVGGQRGRGRLQFGSAPSRLTTRAAQPSLASSASPPQFGSPFLAACPALLPPLTCTHPIITQWVGH